jgi:hypothetical protein
MKNQRHQQHADSAAAKENPRQILSDLLGRVHQLEMLAHNTDLKMSREAFEALVNLFYALFTWLRTTAILSPGSLGALKRGLPEEDAWERFTRGHHAAAWAGVELARFYKRIQAELRSRSKHFVNRLRDLRFGFKLATFDFPPNRWFRDEYERRTDYRPVGIMAVWVARKIEEMRRLKTSRSESRSCGGIEIVEGHLRFRSKNEIGDIMAEMSRSDLVRGEGLKRLDDLPAFGTSNIGDVEAWRKFVLHQVLTQKTVITEFDSLFPQSRENLDGVVAATLRSAWRAVHEGGDMILPEV